MLILSFSDINGIFRMTFQERVSADGLWLVPDNVTAYQALSCNYESLTEEIRGKAIFTIAPLKPWLCRIGSS